MSNIRIINVQKPLLKSFLSNSYQKITVGGGEYGQERYVINQAEEYWDVFCDKDEEFKIFEKYSKQDRSITIEEYKELFLSKINIQKFKGGKEFLDRIYHDVSKIYAVLSKIEEMGLDYCLDITGGAVRDFVNNKPIKDLDIMLSIVDSDANKFILKKMNDVLFLKKHFKTESIVHYLDNIAVKEDGPENDFAEKKQQLMILCFQDLIADKYVRDSSTRDEVMSVKGIYNQDMFKRNGLLGVYKLNTEKLKLNYPVDILLTDLSKNDFIDDFDFDLCKATFSLRSSIHVDFPQNSMELISRFNAERDFWADVHNKKITLNVDGMSNLVLEHSINKHFKKIKEKYPDYSINIVSSEEYGENKKYADYLYMEETMKTNISPNKKIKI